MADVGRLAADRHAIGLTVRLVGRSLRWVGPLLVEVAGLAVVLAQPGPVPTSAVAMFPVLVLVGCWLAAGAGNVDDDGHRELCTASVGSPGRLVVDRAAAAGLVGAVAVALVVLVVGVGASPRATGASDVGLVLAVAAAGTVAGIGLGALVHRPLVERPGPAVVGGVGGALLLVVVPPTTALLRSADAGDLRAAVALAAAAVLVAVALVAVAAALTDRRAR